MRTIKTDMRTQKSDLPLPVEPPVAGDAFGAVADTSAGPTFMMSPEAFSKNRPLVSSLKFSPSSPAARLLAVGRFDAVLLRRSWKEIAMFWETNVSGVPELTNSRQRSFYPQPGTRESATS